MLYNDLNMFLVIISSIFICWFIISNQPKKIKYCNKPLNMMDDEEYINTFLPFIIQDWEKKGKPRGMTLEEYIDKYIITEGK